MADDLGYADLSCYGRRDYTTPNIDRLATEGMKFLQAYANSAVCSATRTALITGRYQYRLPVGLDEPLGTRQHATSACRPNIPRCPRCSGKPATAPRCSANGTSAICPTTARSRAATITSGDSTAARVDYFTHKAGVADPTRGRSLGRRHARSSRPAISPTLLGDRAVKTVSDYAARTPAVPAEPALQRAALALGRTRATRPNRSASARWPTTTAARSKPMPRMVGAMDIAGRPRAPDAGQHRHRGQHHRDLHQRQRRRAFRRYLAFHRQENRASGRRPAHSRAGPLARPH